MGRLRAGLLVMSACALVATAGPGQALGRTPVRALADDLAFVDSRPDARALAFETARRAGARVVRVTLDWSRVAPAGDAKPGGFRASDPRDPAYSWGYIEDAVRDAT